MSKLFVDIEDFRYGNFMANRIAITVKSISLFKSATICISIYRYKRKLAEENLIIDGDNYKNWLDDNMLVDWCIKTMDMTKRIYELSDDDNSDG